MSYLKFWRDGFSNPYNETVKYIVHSSNFPLWMGKFGLWKNGMFSLNVMQDYIEKIKGSQATRNDSIARVNKRNGGNMRYFNYFWTIIQGS